VKSTVSKAGANRKVHVSARKTQKNDSLEGLKKAFLIGLGATVMTAEKLKDAVTDLVDEMVARGDIKPNEAKKVAEDLKKRFQSSKSDFDSTLRKAIASASQTIGKVASDLKKATSKKPAAKKAAAKKAAVKKPVAKKAAAKPAVKKAAVKKAAAKKPVAKKAAAKPAIKKAAVKKPVAKKPVKTVKAPVSKPPAVESKPTVQEAPATA
jgi:histone H1/5